MARTILDQNVIGALSEAMNLGCYANIACDYVGIHESTYYRWLKRGEREEERIIGLTEKIEAHEAEIETLSGLAEPSVVDKVRIQHLMIEVKELDEETEPLEGEWIFVQLRESIKNADAAAEMVALGYIRTAMAKDWRCAMTFLERRHPARWSRRIL